MRKVSFNQKPITSLACIGLIILAALGLLHVTMDSRGESLIQTHQTGASEEVAEVIYDFTPDEEIFFQKIIDEEFTADIGSNNGKIKYVIRNVICYDNIYELCGDWLKNEVLSGNDNTTGYGLSLNFSEFDPILEKPIMYPDYFDHETGKLFNNYCVFVFEIDLTNINAEEEHYGSKYMFNISPLFNLVDRSGELPQPSYMDYFREEIDEEKNGFNSYKLELVPGETKTVHVGYFFPESKCDKPFWRVGMRAEDGYLPGYYDDDGIFCWFDLSEIYASLQSGKVEAAE